MWLRISILITLAGLCLGICVLDNKKGWWLDCGIRDSYLLRIKDFGGAYVRFDFDAGLGDEGGFPYSIDNTNQEQPPPNGIPPYIIPPQDKQKLYQRSSAGGKPKNARRRKGNKKVRPNKNPGRTLSVLEPPPQSKKLSRPVRRRSGGPQQRFMKFQSSEVNPPEVLYSQDKKGIWIRVPAEAADHIKSDHVIDPSEAARYFSAENRRKYDSRRRPKPMMTSLKHSPPGSKTDYYLDLTEERLRNRDRRYPEFDRYSPDDRYALSKYHQDELERFRSPPPLESTTPAPYSGPIIGRVLGELLKLPATTPADTEHVPSFAAQLLVVKDAPVDMHPPEYNNTNKEYSLITKLPRTKFFCEEQEYLPGLYADEQLGCKIFHLCIPAPLGSTIQSFLCPNSTVFDQSILQCNYWQLVDCGSSANHFDANQPLAHNYRRVNAAHLPASEVKDPLTLSLLSDIQG